MLCEMMIKEGLMCRNRDKACRKRKMLCAFLLELTTRSNDFSIQMCEEEEEKKSNIELNMHEKIKDICQTAARLEVSNIFIVLYFIPLNLQRKHSDRKKCNRFVSTCRNLNELATANKTTFV